MFMNLDNNLTFSSDEIFHTSFYDEQFYLLSQQAQLSDYIESEKLNEDSSLFDDESEMLTDDDLRYLADYPLEKELYFAE